MTAALAQRPGARCVAVVWDLCASAGATSHLLVSLRYGLLPLSEPLWPLVPGWAGLSTVASLVWLWAIETHMPHFVAVEAFDRGAYGPVVVPATVRASTRRRRSPSAGLLLLVQVRLQLRLSLLDRCHVLMGKRLRHRFHLRCWIVWLVLHRRGR